MEVLRAMVAASTNRMAVAACDRCGTERGVEWVAGTVIAGPDGWLLAGPPPAAEPALLLADVDLAASRDKADRAAQRRARGPPPRALRLTRAAWRRRPGSSLAAAVPPTTSAQFSLTLRVRIDHRPGMLGRVATAIGQAGGTIGDIELVELRPPAHAARHDRRRGRRGARARDRRGGARGRGRRGRRLDRPHDGHPRRRQARGRPRASRCAPPTTSAWPTRPASPASAARSPADPDKAFQYTIKRNTVAVVSDGTRGARASATSARPRRCR